MTDQNHWPNAAWGTPGGQPAPVQAAPQPTPAAQVAPAPGAQPGTYGTGTAAPGPGWDASAYGAPPAPAAAPKRRGWIVGLAAVLSFFILGLFSIGSCTAVMTAPMGALSYDSPSWADTVTGDTVGIISIDGTIQYDGSTSSPEGLKAQLKQIFKKKPIPNQPTNKKGKPYPYFIYEQAVVFVDDMANVTDVQQTLIDMGFQAESQMQWIEQSQQTYDVIQLVLGGIGAISLFVAAIGIANTMMMSIYERTKEIGVIKVLGCDMGNIRNMFLMESGFIGFMGGVIGLIISFTVSYVMNNYLGIGQIMMGIDGDISRIPLWLAASAIGFAILVGMVAGFFPSLRAMRLSPLAAIRNE